MWRVVKGMIAMGDVYLNVAEKDAATTAVRVCAESVKKKPPVNRGSVFSFNVFLNVPTKTVVTMGAGAFAVSVVQTKAVRGGSV